MVCMEGAREDPRVGAQTAKGRVKAGNIGMLGRIGVFPRWEDDPLRINDGRRLSGCRVRRRINPPE